MHWTTGPRPRPLGTAALLAAAALTGLTAGALAPTASASARAVGAQAVQAPAATTPAAPELAIEAGAPDPVDRGKPATIKVKVRNQTTRKLVRVTLTVKPAKGVTATLKGVRRGHTAKLPTIQAGKSRTVTIRLTLGKDAADQTENRLVVTKKGKRKAEAIVELARKGAVNLDSLAGRYFWNTQLIGNTSYYYAYAFTSEAFVYRGTYEGAAPVCTAVTAVDDKDGCLPYTYDHKTGALTINGQPGAVPPAGGDAGLTLGQESFVEATTPPAGQRFDTALTYLNGSGFCPYCSFVTIGLRLFPDGQFARSAGVSSSTPLGDVTALPADQRGTYEVRPDGTLVSTYASGKVEVENVHLMRTDAGTFDAAQGLLLDGSAFWGPASGVG